MPFLSARALFLGLPLDLLDRQEILRAIHLAMQERIHLYQITMNTATAVTALRSAEFAEYIHEADLITADGMGVVWGGRSLGIRVPERVPGIEIMLDTLTLCEREGFKPYFFGAKEDVLSTALAETKKRWPKLHIAGARNGYFGPDDERAIVEEIRNQRPDCLFVGITSPIKEQFCHRWLEHLDIPYVVGVGGSFDILAGKTRRAPKFMQNSGTEWLFRIYQEPRRMLWRYISTNFFFLLTMIRAFLSGRQVQIAQREIMGKHGTEKSGNE